MEHLSWKDADIKADFKNCKNLGDLVKEIELRQCTQGHVICKISVNGMSLDEIDEKRFSESTIDEIESLDIQYTAIRSLVTETEVSTMAYAKSLVPIALHVADGFRSNNLNLAHTEFKTLVESLDSLLQANQLILNVRNQEGLEISPAIVEIDQKFVFLLNEILNSYEKRDFILTADVLEYDLTQSLTHLSTILEETIGKPGAEQSEKSDSMGR